MEHQEKEVICQLKSGMNENFTLLYKQYSNKVYNLAFRMCGNREDAEDITQKTFIQAIKNIKSFNGESGIYTWLYTITKNLCFRQLENRKKGQFSALDDLVHAARSQDNMEDMTNIEKQFYVSQVKEGCLLGLLRCLSFNQRVAFILSMFLELKTKDISIILNKSETATRVLICRARQNIRDFLCKNCSIFDSANPCHCENLINFSLKQGWITKRPNHEIVPPSLISSSTIEREIKDLIKLTLLYSSLEDRLPSEKITQIIRDEINKQKYAIFSHKK